METATGLTILGTAVGSAKLVEKVLGPTAEYLGEGLRSWTEKRVENTKRIFQHAAMLLGDKVDTPGAVPPKVLKGILDDGSFCDDQLAAEYFGGVLASSRSNVSRDDRGAAFIALLGRLTTYQIRTHFIFYHVIKSLYEGQPIGISTSEERNQLQTFIPSTVIFPQWPSPKKRARMSTRLSATQCLVSQESASSRRTSILANPNILSVIIHRRRRPDSFLSLRLLELSYFFGLTAKDGFPSPSFFHRR